jgi:hypothetical protein
MLEALLFYVFLLLLLLFLLLWYAGIPAVLAWTFFRSEWVPQTLKNLVSAVLGVLVCLWGGYYYLKQQQKKQQVAPHPHWPSVRLTVHQAGLRPYPLGRGSIEEVRSDLVPHVVVSGDLPDGQRLRARLRMSPRVVSATAAQVASVSIDNKLVKQATGWSIYKPDSQTVRGSFRCVLPSGKQLSVSFPPTSVTLPIGYINDALPSKPLSPSE